MNIIQNFFLLDDYRQGSTKVPIWRISALRILLTAGTLLCMAVFWDTYENAINLNLQYVILLSGGFFFTTSLLLFLSKRFYLFCSHGLLISIVLASVAMNLFLTDLKLAQVGSIFMFSCPTVALILLGYRVAGFYSLLNISTFLIIVENIDFTSFTQYSGQLPDANWYINGLVFIFFNICIPLTVARAITAANRLNNEISISNKLLDEKKALYKSFFIDSVKAKVIVDNDFYIIDVNNQAQKIIKINRELLEPSKKISDFIKELNIELSPKEEQIIKIGNSFQKIVLFRIDNRHSFYQFTDVTKEQFIKQNLQQLEQENKELKYLHPQYQLPNTIWFSLQGAKLKQRYQKDFFIIAMRNTNCNYIMLKHGGLALKNKLIATYKLINKHFKNALLLSYIGDSTFSFIITANEKESLIQSLSQMKIYFEERITKSGNITTYDNFSFGVVRHKVSDESLTASLSKAKEALKETSHNSPIAFYNNSVSQEFINKHEIAILLTNAISKNEIEIAYQPKFSDSHFCIGFEALARWNSPILGQVSPDRFIPIAEEYLIINKLTDLIIEKVTKQINEWQKTFPEVLPIAINVSAVDFNQADFITNLLKHLTTYNVKPDLIEIEITETSLEKNRKTALKLIESLQAWGFKVSVDDFGVGYSNISRLAEYPIDKLKLDRSLITEVGQSKRLTKLVKAIQNMCNELNIKSVAEGIETEQQFKLLTKMGCKEFQGYYFAKPQSPSEVSAFLPS